MHWVTTYATQKAKITLNRVKDELTMLFTLISVKEGNLVDVIFGILPWF